MRCSTASGPLGVNPNGAISITESLLDARALRRPTQGVYIGGVLDLRDGPVVVEARPIPWAWSTTASSATSPTTGNAGPDRSQGGRYLYLPPDWEGEEPDGLLHLPFANLPEHDVLAGLFLVGSDPGPPSGRRALIKVYPLGETPDAADMKFVNISGAVLQHGPRQRHPLLRGSPGRD